MESARSSFAFSLRERLLLTVVCAAIAGALAGVRDVGSDFDQLTGAATAWMAGQNPYEAVGPGRAVDWSFPLLYPFTAVLVAVPIALLPYPPAFFAGLGTALFVWGITSKPELRFSWFAVPTFAVLHAIRMVQWSPILVGAGLTPAWGFLLACKPTIGAAIWVAYPRLMSLSGSAGLMLLSLFARPKWPLEWWAALQQSGHMAAPITFWGGPLLLLALLRWRLPEARLLAALSCVPQTAFMYEAVPLFLIPRSYEEGFLLSLATFVVLLAINVHGPDWIGLDPVAQYMAERQLMGQWMVWVLYLPCLFMVLRRPNVSEPRRLRDERTESPSKDA